MKPAAGMSNVVEMGQNQDWAEGETQPKRQTRRWLFAAALWMDQAVTGFPPCQPGKGGNCSRKDTRGGVLARDFYRERCKCHDFLIFKFQVSKPIRNIVFFSNFSMCSVVELIPLLLLRRRGARRKTALLPAFDGEFAEYNL